MLNQANTIVTYILELEVLGKTAQIRHFIQNESSAYTLACDEPKTMRFEWFMSEDEKQATLIEMFADSDGAKQRLQNLQASPIVEPFQQLFKITSLTVLGAVKPDLRLLLDGWDADCREYAGGFYKGLDTPV